MEAQRHNLVPVSHFSAHVTSAQAAPHVSKAQKRRQAREQEEAERERRIAAEQAQAGDSERVLEERSLAQLLQPLGLAVQDIPVSSPPIPSNSS